MSKVYEKPSFLIIVMETSDIVTSSGVCERTAQDISWDYNPWVNGTIGGGDK